MLDIPATMRRQQEMEACRSTFDTKWQGAAELFLPRQADYFNGSMRSEGQDPDVHVFDEYGQEALKDGVSIFEGFVMPRGSLWQMLAPPSDIPELKKLQHVREWFEIKSNRLHEYRNDAASGFATQVAESVSSLMCFGNQDMTVEVRTDPVTKRKVGLSYSSNHIGRVFIDAKKNGLPNRRHEKIEWTAEQALDFFGADKLQRAPKVMEAAADPKKAYTQKFQFLYVIQPNTAIDTGRLDWRGKPLVAGYLSLADKEWVDIGGYRHSPSVYSRFFKSPRETYGRGPGTEALRSIRSAQQIMLDLMVGAEMALMPPLAAADDMLDQQIVYGAREVTYGAIDARGHKMVDRLFDVGDMNPALALQEKVHERIDRAFYRNLLTINQDLKSHVTNDQLYDRTQEKGILLTPLSRQETEWFTPMMDREVDCMAEMGDFDDMPHELREAGGAKAVVYDNPLNRAMKAEQAGGFFKMLNLLTPLMNVDQNVAKVIAQEYPAEKVVRGLGDVLAVPASWQASDQERAQFQAQLASEQQQAALLQAMPVVGKTAADLSRASDAA